MFYRCAHICRSHLSPSHMCTPSTKAHFVNRIAPCLQVDMCTLRSHVYASFTGTQTFYRQNITLTGSHRVVVQPLQTCISRLHLQNPFKRFHSCSSYLHTIFTNANLFTRSHPFPTHTRRSTVQMCTSRYTTKDIGSITFECVRSVRKVS